MKAFRYLIFGITILLSLLVVLAAQADRETPGQPDQPAVGEYAYFTNYNPPIIAIVNTTTYEIETPIDLSGYGCGTPEQAAMHPDGVRVFVSCYSTNQVLVIDTNSNTVVASISDVPNAHGIAFTNDGSHALVGSRFIWAPITVIDTITNTVVDSIDIDGYAYKLASHPEIDVVYVAVNDGSSGSILVIDANTFLIINEIPLGDYLSDVDVSPDGQWIYAVGGNTFELVVINATTHEIYTSVPVLNWPNGLAVAPDSSEVYVMSFNTVEVINTNSWTVTETMDGLNNPGDAAVTCDGAKLFVTSGSYYFTAFDLLTYTFIDNIQFGAGEYTYGVTICPPFISNKVALLPESQSKSGVPGQVVVYSETLRNSTGITETFNLSYANNVWDTNLSETSLGPLANGEMVTFTVSVTIPPEASWYLTDTVVVTATSVVSPTEFFDSASFTTQAYAPPQISVEPGFLSSSQYVGVVLNQAMMIANGNGVTLTYRIDTGVGHDPSLADTLAALNQNYTNVITAIPNRFDFSEGVTGYYIEDGGNHMYDNGNYLGTNLGGSIGYSNSAIRESYELGSPGRYFTRKYPGLFVLAADVEGVDTFEIIGDLGANGSGFADGTILQTERYGVTYYGFVKRVHETDVPSVNHLIIVADNLSANQTYATNTDSDYHQVYGLSGSTRLYYLLYAGQGGYFIDDAATQEIMEAFLDAIPLLAEASWLSTDPSSGSVPNLSEVPIEVTFDATETQPGTYSSGLIINSNDSARSTVFVTATLSVLPTESMGWVEGSIIDDDNDLPLEADLEALGQPFVVTSDPITGYYKLWLEQGSYTLQASAGGYITKTAQMDITAQSGVLRDFNMIPFVPAAIVEPGSLSVELLYGQSEIRVMTLTNQGPAPLEYELAEGLVLSNPVMVLHLDEQFGPTFYDASGNQNHAICPYYACPEVGLDAPFGTALRFNGSSNMIYVQDSPYIDQIEDSDRVTIAAWINIHGWYDGGFSIADKYDWYDGVGWEFGIDSDSGMIAFIGTSCSFKPVLDRWYHVAVTYDISTGVVQYYVDGETLCNVESDAGIDETSTDPVYPLYIGYGPSGRDEYSNGLIDEVYLFDRALSAEEVRQLFEVGNSGKDVSWLSAEPVSGTLDAYSSQQVDVTFSTEGMQPGLYEDSMYLLSNDPDTPLVVPVTLTVTATVTPTTVSISGAEEGFAGKPYTFTATTKPISTTLPLTYTWHASGQESTTHTDGITDTVSFNWELPGTQLITVTASNSAGSVQASTVVHLVIPETRIYMPMIIQTALPGNYVLYWRRQEPI